MYWYTCGLQIEFAKLWTTFVKKFGPCKLQIKSFSSHPCRLQLAAQLCKWICNEDVVTTLWFADFTHPTLHHNMCKKGVAICKSPHRPIKPNHGHDIHAACTWPNFCRQISNLRDSDTHFFCRLLLPHPTLHNNFSKQVGCMQTAKHRIVQSNQIILITPTPTAINPIFQLW